MRWLVVVWLAAGCFSPQPTAGAPCGQNESCPTPLVCVTATMTCERTPIAADARIDGPTMIDAAICAGPERDEDGDGVYNQCDNCPVTPNPLQEDAGEMQAGAAPDGVGDACDPNPTQAGDQLELVAFHDDPDEPITRYGNHSYNAGVLRIGGLLDGGEGGYNYEVQRPLARLILRFTVVSVSPEQRWAGAWYYTGQGTGVFAHGTQDMGGDAVFVLKEQASTNTYSEPYVDVARFGPGNTYVLTVDTGPSVHRMTIERVGGETGQGDLAIALPATVLGYVESHKMIIDVAHFAVYTR